jgi:hypothetical protein
MHDIDEQIRELIDSGYVPLTAAEVMAAHHSSPSKSHAKPRYPRPRRMKSYAIGALAMATAICVLIVVLLVGVYSSNPTGTPGRPAGVPASWQEVTFGGLTMYAPGNWPVGSEHSWGDCGVEMQPFFKANAVELDTGANPVLYHCPRISPNVAPVNGLLVDPGPYGPLPDAGSTVPGQGKPLHVNGLTIQGEGVAVDGFVIAAVYIPGVARPVAVEVGTSGGFASTIVNSIRPSGSTPTVPPSTPNTVKSSTGQWPSRTITTSGGLGSIVPTENAVYWLSTEVPQINNMPFTVTPVRYDLTSGEVKNGPGISSDYPLSNSDLAVAGDSVWVTVASGRDVLVLRLDPTTLAIQERISLPVKNNFPSAATFYPVITSATSGPVWVAGGEDLWALNPATGAIETEFDADDEIGSLSTDPTGTLLYTAGQTNAASGDWSVNEYDAQTGTDLVNREGAGVSSTVAATPEGVWVSLRSGNAVGVAQWSGGGGGEFELSAKSLQLVAPRVSELQRFGAFLAVGGVESGVSEGTLWLTGLGSGDNPTLMCANPATGAVEAAESTNVGSFGFIASGHSLYAVTSPTWGLNPPHSVVVITPPAACFG